MPQSQRPLPIVPENIPASESLMYCHSEKTCLWGLPLYHALLDRRGKKNTKHENGIKYIFHNSKIIKGHHSIQIMRNRSFYFAFGNKNKSPHSLESSRRWSLNLSPILSYKNSSTMGTEPPPSSTQKQQQHLFPAVSIQSIGRTLSSINPESQGCKGFQVLLLVQHPVLARALSHS